MLGALAEFERSRIRERSQAGLAAARRVGRTGGRPPKLTDDDIEAAKAMLANPDISVTQIAHPLSVSAATLYRYIPAARTANAGAVINGSLGATDGRKPRSSASDAAHQISRHCSLNGDSTPFNRLQGVRPPALSVFPKAIPPAKTPN